MVPNLTIEDNPFHPCFFKCEIGVIIILIFFFWVMKLDFVKTSSCMLREEEKCGVCIYDYI